MKSPRHKSGAVATRFNAFGEMASFVFPWTNVYYLYDPAGNPIGISETGGEMWRQFIPLHGRSMVSYSVDNQEMYFLHPNLLGSVTMNTNQTGAPVGDLLIYPWGMPWTSMGDLSVWQYAQFQNDKSLIDPTPTRWDDPSMGRWLSTDPLGGDISNPQSLNRYAYVLNSPVTLTDPSGLCGEPDSSYIDSNGVVQVVGSEPCWWQIFGLGFCTVTGGFGCGDNGPNANINPSGGGGAGSTPAPAPKPTPPAAKPVGTPQILQACSGTILTGVNQVFGTSLNSQNLVLNAQNNPTGFIQGGGANIFIDAQNLPVPQFNAINPGRYPLSPVSLVTGITPSLHVPSNGVYNGQAVFVKVNNGTSNAVNFTAHIDSAFPYNPLGLLLHEIVDVAGAASRNPCPERGRL